MKLSRQNLLKIKKIYYEQSLVKFNKPLPNILIHFVI